MTRIYNGLDYPPLSNKFVHLETMILNSITDLKRRIFFDFFVSATCRFNPAYEFDIDGVVALLFIICQFN